MLVSRNAPKVLATLFLLSYAKLICITITIVSFTTMEYPDHTKQSLWLLMEMWFTFKESTFHFS